jgi:hypothetical protein
MDKLHFGEMESAELYPRTLQAVKMFQDLGCTYATVDRPSNETGQVIFFQGEMRRPEGLDKTAYPLYFKITDKGLIPHLIESIKMGYDYSQVINARNFSPSAETAH